MSEPGGSERGGKDARDRDDVRDDVQAELDAHFEGTVDLLVQRGWSEDDAREEARRRFGDVERYALELRRLGRRRRLRHSIRTGAEAIAASVLCAVRDLRRSPGFSAAVVLTLALGIGANAAVFRVVDRLLLSPPEGIERPSEVQRLHQTLARADGSDSYGMNAFTFSDVAALRGSGLPIELGAIQLGMPETLGEGAGALRVRVARVDRAFLPLLGVTTSLGRDFAPEDHRASAAPVALLGHRLWTTRFGADPSVLGSTIRVGDGRYQVVGVLPAGFIGAMPPAIDVWIPLEAVAEGQWGSDWQQNQSVLAFYLIARVHGEGAERLTAEAPAILRRSRIDYALRGDLLAVTTASLIPGESPDGRFGATVSVSRWLAGVSLLVLLVACANVANLFLARGERVRRDTAVRLALGAGGARLRLELLVRALVVALIGSAGAFGVALWGGGALEEMVFGPLDFTASPRTGRMIAFMVGAAFVAAVLAGLIPALRAPAHDLRQGMEGGGRTTTGTGRTRRVLVALQAAMSVLLLTGATLFVLSFRAAAHRDLGFDVDRLIMVNIERGEGEVPDARSLYAQAEAAVRSVPGVVSAARTVGVPFVTLYGLQARRPEGEAPAREQGQAPDPLSANAVGADFFSTMGVPILRGRPIDSDDLTAGAEPVAVVSREAAARLWPGRDPLGRCVEVGTGERRVPCARVVGVAESHVQRDLTEERGPLVWVPLTLPAVGAGPSLIVRVDAAPEETLAGIRSRILALPGVRYAEVASLADFAGNQMRSWRLGATVFSLFGVIALAIAAVGLYALLAYDVAQRHREIGIRMALGARGGRVIRHVAGGALWAVGAGLAVGLALAALGAGRLELLLLDVSPRDPAVFALVAAALLVISAAAAALPAWRAVRVDPRESLTAE